MFTELEKKMTSLPFGETELWLRFDNAALLKIERSGYDPFDIKALNENGKAARAFLSAGLDRCIAGLELESRRSEIINAMLSGKNTAMILLAIDTALLEALPLPGKNRTVNASQSKTAENMFSFFVDIMHRTEGEFWRATLREVSERCDRYCILMGYKKEPLQIKRFDDE